MYKIFISVRNRLAITCKAISAIKKHSKLEHQIYIYDNCTTNKIQEHFMYFSLLYGNGLISKVVFNTTESTFNCFSKAVSSNDFGATHEFDPMKNNTNFLVFLDNDIIVTPGWDEIISKSWEDVKNYGYNNIKIIGQYPGGIKDKIEIKGKEFAGYSAVTGRCGGSALWAVQNNFFRDVGFLNVKNLYGIDKKHDTEYWGLLHKASEGKHYILGLKTKLGIHCGRLSGSVCNVLHRGHHLTKSKKEELIQFDKEEEFIDSLNFDEFYNLIKEDKNLEKDW